MKKYFYFLAIAVLFAACQPNNDLGTPFQKGQKVTLSATIANPNGGANQLPGKQRVSGLDDNPSDPTNGAIKLTWNKGDQIKVTVNGQSEIFTLIGDGGSETGEFEGTMPADGNSYTVTYPVEAPALTTQTYVPNGFGDELMAMSGNGTLDGGFTLTATNALLGLQLTGVRTVTKVVVTNPVGNKTYTLDCGAGVQLTTEPTLFYIVLPKDGWSKGFSIDVTHHEMINGAKSEYTCNFTKSSAANFADNQAMIMPEQEVYILKTLTFEDDPSNPSFEPYYLYYDDYMATLEETIESWSDLIDEPQYGGPLLYGPNGMGWYESYMGDEDTRIFESYYWFDEYNTKLRHQFKLATGWSGDSYGYWNGGIAVSDYTEMDASSVPLQLTVYEGGNNGSSNFAVATTADMMGTQGENTYIEFGDGEARIIDHMYICGSAYVADQIGSCTYYKITATGYNRDTEIGTVTHNLMSDGTLCQDWKKWNLSSLGKVTKVIFTIEHNGGATPYYFAFDDVAVRFQK